MFNPFKSTPLDPSRKTILILIMGALITVNPFAIDMYLASFPAIAASLNAPTGHIAYSLSSYFLGLAGGQLFYGPLLDRFGRKRPIYLGLALFIVASLGCAFFAHSVATLVALRLLQGLGGVAQTGSMAMVRDFFPQKESARIFSRLMLVLSVSPLFAPTVGSFVSVAFGWQSVFFLLAAIVTCIVYVMYRWLPEGHQPDTEVSLRPLPLARGYLDILRNPQFITYVMSGAFAFSGLFAYLAASPMIFMEKFHTSAHLYGGIFALLSTGIIGAGQVNVWVMKHFPSDKIFRAALVAQIAVTLLFLGGTLAGGFNLPATVAIFYVFLACLGFVNPNGAAIALAPFTRNIGRATALMGFLQISMSGLMAALVGVVGGANITGVALLMCATPLVALATLLVGKRAIKRQVKANAEASQMAACDQHEAGL